MKLNKKTIEEYAAIAKKSSRDMKGCIRAHLVANCPKFAGHEDKFDECIEYVTECAREILNNRPGDVADDACYKMARDFFNDELWEKDAKAAEHKKLVSAAENATEKGKATNSAYNKKWRESHKEYDRERKQKWWRLKHPNPRPVGRLKKEAA